MAWRTVLVQKPAKLRKSRNQLEISNDDGIITLPLEDIRVLILESPQIRLTSALLSACQDCGVAIITCNTAHIPNGLLLPFHKHSRQSKVALLQVNTKNRFKNRLWKWVICNKIRGQGDCLKLAGNDLFAKRMYNLSEHVTIGDKNNLEAQASRYYWTRLMGDDFRRGVETKLNAALNYGYAIIRGYIARSQVSYGLLPTFGIHHSSELNAFNLTDDILELFRPFVDYLVYSLKTTDSLSSANDSLDIELRQKIANIASVNCNISDRVYTLGKACDLVTESLVTAFESGEQEILRCPSLIIE